MKSRIKELITVLLIQLVITLPFYTADIFALTISNVKVTRTAQNSAQIQWDTDNLSNGRIKYGKTADLDFIQRHDNYILNHTINLFNGIESDANYFFAVESTDLVGNSVVDNNSGNFYTFKTPDITPPPLVSGLKVVSTTSNSIFLTWDSVNIPDFNHFVVYRNRIPIANTTTNFYNDTNLIISGSNIDFMYRVSAVDNSSNEGQQSDTFIASTQPIDSTPPVISSVDSISVTDTTARITWLTDENSTSTVFFGINSTDKTADKIKTIGDLVTNHTIVIDGLTKGVKYFFKVGSCDASNNCANSSNQSFVAGKDTTPPFINLTIPRYVNRRVIDIVGSTEQFTSITLFVNDMNAPKRSLGNDEVGISGKFAFSQIQLEQDNIIKVFAIDKSGNKNSKTFEVGVDTELPIVKLNPIPSRTSKTNLSISGSVNELVTIKVYADFNGNLATTPAQVTGLNATKIGQNSVELHWDEVADKDFSHYVVFRDDVPIATTKPSNFNLFIDALVDSGKSYTYRISAVNLFANEGPRSGPVTATTLQGGAILNLKPPQVDIFEDFRRPIFFTNASGNFDFGARLDRGDGVYNLKLIFQDRADNNVIIEKAVTLDTRKPNIQITNPPSGAFIYENLANQIDIIGKTKPNSRVHLFVDRTPFGLFNNSFEISGFPNEIQDLPETKLDAKCRSQIAGTTFCSTGADFSVDADSDGNFKIENVDLTVTFGGATRFRQISPTKFEETQLNLDVQQQARRVTLLVIATDQTGQRGVARQDVRLGTCWSGNQSWDIIPLTQYQSPGFISTERLAQGIETIYFYFNYSYIGPGSAAKIKSVSIANACGTRELLDKRFNLSCQILSGGVPVQLLNPPDNTVSYSAAPLARLPGMDTFLENDWKGFFKAVNKELSFPVKVTIQYQHDPNNDGTIKTEVQTTCEQLSYVIDNSIIDPRKVLPDWLLFDFVDILQDSIKTINEIQKQLNSLLEFVTIGCITSFGLNVALGLYRRLSTYKDEKIFAFLNAAKDINDAVGKLAEFFVKSPLKTANPNDPKEKDDCQQIVQAIAREKKEFKLKYLTDADLRKCFPSTAAAWESEAKVYKLMRYSCDRVFGHTAPSKWTETRNDEAIFTQVQLGEQCTSDQSYKGQPLRAMNCDEFARQYTQFSSVTSLQDKKCVLVTTEKDKRGVYTVEENIPGSNNLYRLSFSTGVAPRGETSIYAIRRTSTDDVNYITKQSGKCSDICGIKAGEGQLNQFSGISSKDKKTQIATSVTVQAPKLTKEQEKKLESDILQGRATNLPKYDEKISGCAKASDCTSFNVNKEVFIGEIKHNIQSAYRAGFTEDCFYDSNKGDVTVVSENPNQRVECCCINAQPKGKDIYYQPDDEVKYGEYAKKQAHESKTDQGATPTELNKEDFANMKWSYRYYKEKFQTQDKREPSLKHTEYNPKRYTEGRDFPACFGQNNLIYEALGRNVITVDPFRQYGAEIQCAHIAGIINKLQILKNLMSALSTCLIQVRTTGRADAGACKELFTQYVCSSIWQFIRMFTDGCAPTEVETGCKDKTGKILKYGPECEDQSESIFNYIKQGLKGVHDSVSDLQSTVVQEYGNAKLNELFGVGEESIARKICLGAFGYDWGLNLRSFIDAAYSTPFSTLVQAVTRSREFLTVEPGSFKPKYEYRASWVINPGCDFERYDVYLSCVGRKEIDKYPNDINCGSVGAPSLLYTGKLPGTGPAQAYSQCDCMGLPNERPSPPVFSGRLTQNVLEDKAIPPGKGVLTSDVRYDHVKIVLRPDRKIKGNIKQNCFPTGYDEGVFYFPLIDKSPKDIFDCHVDYLSGSYICGQGAAFGAKKGTANFLDLVVSNQINDVNAFTVNDIVFNAGDKISVKTTIRNVGADKCLKVSLDGENQVLFVKEGINQYKIDFEKPLTIGTVEGIQASTGIAVERINLQNTDGVVVNFIFYDTNDNGFIDFDSDLIEVSNVEGQKKVKGSELGESPRIFGTGNNQVELSVKDRKLIVNLPIQKAIFAITAAEIPRPGGILSKTKNPEGTGAEVGYVSAQIQIKPFQQITQTGTQVQGKKLIVGLYHTKEGADTSDGNPDHCNLNDKVYSVGNSPQERPITIKVEQKATSASKQGAVIVGSAAAPTPVKDQNEVVISANILYNDKSRAVLIGCDKPDGGKILDTPAIQEGNNYKLRISKNELTFAGTYKCTITAPSLNPNVNPGTAIVTFEVMCGGVNGQYGKCVAGILCKDVDQIVSGGRECPTIVFEGNNPTETPNAPVNVPNTPQPSMDPRSEPEKNRGAGGP